MKKLIFTALTFVFIVGVIQAQEKTYSVKSFDKLIVSPHIEVNLVEGSDESVVVDNTKVSLDKINVEVEGRTLRVYLDGAKVVTKSERVSNDKWRGNKSLYGSSYLEIAEGEISRQVFRAYGESEVNTVGMNAEETKITAYGESNFRVKVSDRLKVTCYGETNVSYSGDPEVDMGLIIGEAKITKIAE